MNFMEDHKMVEYELHKEMRESYIDYAMSVIVGRALPDVRDGLKPVHRRILYGMSQLGVTPDKSHKKSARIVGEVMGKYHPHGDSSIYDAMVRLAQPFNIRYMLVDGHGNFGSVDGDGAAAMRYTEARMTPLALQMLRDIEKDTVDFIDNFDGEEKEPTVLPSRFPNLLVNGSNGIAVGMATNIPPHNLGEVIDGVVEMIDKPDCDVEDLIKIVKGPDFPTGATIMGKSGIRDAYRTGQGKVIVRAVSEIEPLKGGKHQIVVSQIPYQVNKARLIEKMADLVKNKVIEGIGEIRDESNRKGMRIVIETKRDVNPRIVLNKLYKHTQMQDSVSMIMLAIVDGRPRILNLHEILSEYLKHQKVVITRRTKYDLAKAEARAHILEGLRIALDNIDEIIRIIRSSYDNAKQKLMDSFSLSEIQAQAILDMRLARLQGLEREKIEKEYNELLEKIAWFKRVLSEEELLMGIIKEEILEIKQKYGDERRTEISADSDDIEDEELIEEEEVAVTLTHLGYIKRVSADTYKSQKRGGKGITGLTVRENDFVKQMITTSTHDYIMFFTNKGKVHRLKAYEINDAQRQSKGIPIQNYLSMSDSEKVTAMISIKEYTDNEFMVCVTKKGIIKKTEISQFDTSRKSGIIAINLQDGDSLISTARTTGDSEIIIVTKKGKSITFQEEEVRVMGRAAKGVRAIQLDDDDEVVGMEIKKKGYELLVVTQSGFGKRTKMREYKLQARGGKGMLTYDKSKINKTGSLVGALSVKEDDEIMLINSDGIIIRMNASEISVLGRATQGIKLMRVEEDANIIAIAKVVKQEEKENENDSEENAQISLNV